MRADLSRARWEGLLLALALLSTGCVSLTPPPGRGTSLRYTPSEATRPASAQRKGVESPRLLVATPETETPERLHRRRVSRGEVTAAGPDSAEREARQKALAAQWAFRGAIREVSGSTRRISVELARLKASSRGLASGNPVFLPYTHYLPPQPGWPTPLLRWRIRTCGSPCCAWPAHRWKPPWWARSYSPSGSTSSTSPTSRSDSTSTPWRRCSRTCGAGRRCSSP